MRLAVSVSEEGMPAVPAVCLVGGLGGEIGGEQMDMASSPASPGDSAPLSEGESDEESAVHSHLLIS